MQLVDTHCHLDATPLGDDPQGVLVRARAADVGLVIVPAHDRQSWSAVETLGAQPGVAVALGLHPWAALQGLAEDELAARLRASGAVAVGEIGLDHQLAGVDGARRVGDAERRAQRDVCARQLALAHDLGLPVILHCRRAAEELLALLARHAPGLPGVVHAFSRGPELAARFVAQGLHVSFAGTITQPRAERARRAAQAVPAERLLVETDAPCIALQGIRAADVEPAHARLVAQELARLRGTTLAELAQRTTDNARALFGR